ncbi:hypothetical protein LB523_11870 [Mesorhizobium sp. ESP-6-4]|uniref:hypothetical protein n=1 Tax=Mesorhizobium sp. ESP-6-4 TaxID=2876624 RepID=UPI001CCB43F0|nr:hypothetical protein [Mesorhizobium sp. ESP-6-4]MBZ9659742.1 hypothetical protein [Mesorhizobium sp. ESP-6-4]
MTIRITPTFQARRIGSVVVATIVENFPASVTLTANQCRDAAEAFNTLAVMLMPAEDIYDDSAESKADRDYQLAKEEAA